MRNDQTWNTLKKIIGDREYDSIKRGLLLVEEFLVEEFARKAPEAFREEILRVITSGGKRVRPLLVLICGRLNRFKMDELVTAAACVEAVHTASLIHDDVVDNADVRRGTATTYRLFGVDFAVRSGDYLFARSFEVLTRLKSSEIVSSLADASEDLSLGELDGALIRGFGETTVEQYLKWISRKTASLFRASCEIGAIVSEAEVEEVEMVAKFGHFLGIAFQMFDDILDLTGDSEVLGKPSGSDLREGFLTLPYLLAVESKEFGERIKMAVRGEMTAVELQSLLDELSRSEYVPAAKELARRYVLQASSSIEGIRNEGAKESLLKVANYVVERYY